MNTLKLQYFSILILTISSLLVSTNCFAQNQVPPATLDCYKPSATKNVPSTALNGINIPDLTLVNQHGKSINFKELVAEKVVVMNFIFTTCTTVCPPMGVNFTHLQSHLQPHIDANNLVMLSISIDPVTDTPQRLKSWSEKFGGGEDWHLLTGQKAVVDRLLKDLRVFTPLKEDHAPIMLIGKEGSSDWVRTNALANPDQLAKNIETYLTPRPVAKTVKNDNPDRAYFTDVRLVSQCGEEMRLYSDLMKDKIVVINPFFLRCTGACPVMNTMMQDLQNHFGDRVGKDIHLISISVDPEYDTPEKVAEYAQAMGAGTGTGRYYLTGAPENVHQALFKLGNGVSNPDEHKNVLMIGNVSSRLWKKANGLAPVEDIIAIVESVLKDKL